MPPAYLTLALALALTLALAPTLAPTLALALALHQALGVWASPQWSHPESLLEVARPPKTKNLFHPEMTVNALLTSAVCWSKVSVYGTLSLRNLRGHTMVTLADGIFGACDDGKETSWDLVLVSFFQLFQ
jgi:hypothetical protein